MSVNAFTGFCAYVMCQRPTSRFRRSARWLLGIAVLEVAGIVISGCGATLASTQTSSISTSALCGVWTTRIWEGQNPNSYFEHIAGSSENDVWVSALNTLWHWDGSDWSRVNPSIDGEIDGISVGPDGQVWTVQDGTPDEERIKQLVISSREADKWSALSSPQFGAYSYGAQVWSIAITPNKEVWVAGNYKLAWDAIYDRAQVLHWNGRGWSAIRPPDSDAPAWRDTTSFMLAVKANSNSDAWALGIRGASLLIMKAQNDQVTWDSVPVDANGQLGSAEADGLAAVTPDDVWLYMGGLNTPGYMVHWNGEEWSSFSLQGVLDSKIGAVQLGVRISALASDDVWAVGEGLYQPKGGYPFLIHWDGKAWMNVPLPVIDESFILGDVYASPDGVWVVGGRGGWPASFGAQYAETRAVTAYLKKTPCMP